MQKGITREQIGRVARIYKYNQDASQALGITLRSFGRLCRKYSIETLLCRRQRHFKEDLFHTVAFAQELK